MQILIQVQLNWLQIQLDFSFFSLVELWADKQYLISTKNYDFKAVQYTPIRYVLLNMVHAWLRDLIHFCNFQALCPIFSNRPKRLLCLKISKKNLKAMSVVNMLYSSWALHANVVKTPWGRCKDVVCAHNWQFWYCMHIWRRSHSALTDFLNTVQSPCHRRLCDRPLINTLKWWDICFYSPLQ